MSKRTSWFVVALSLAILPVALRAADDSKSTKKGDAKAAAAAGDSADAKAEDGKLKGRLPNNYSKLGLSDTQKQKIYGLQASYASQIEELQKKMNELQTKRDGEIHAVLTADQQKKFDELTGDSSKSKAAKKETKGAKGDAPMAKADSK